MTMHDLADAVPVADTACEHAATVIRMELTARYTSQGGRRDCATCEWWGRRFEAVSRHGATMALARLLVEAGCPDLPWEAGRPGKRDMFGPSLHRLAGLTVEENDHHGPVFRPFKPRSAEAGRSQDRVEEEVA